MHKVEVVDQMSAKSEPRLYYEKIGDREWQLEEQRLHVHDEVALWEKNPRLCTRLPQASVSSEQELEAALQDTGGYDTLRKSIDDLGQMEPIYVWRTDENSKYLVLEGATRVSILRGLDRKYVDGVKEGKFRYVRAKILPPEFSETERAILLARVHVRGSGVRAWGRYVEGKFIHETVVGKNNGQPPLMNITQMSQCMEKSVSWVQRLRDAYEFSCHFIDHVDADDGEQLAARYFTVLEELSKVKTIGSQLRDYTNPNYDNLRAEVFDMVQNEVFREHRDARFLKDFHDDPDKWEQLKSGQRHISSQLALEIKANASSPKAKISAIPQLVQRTIDHGKVEFDEDDAETLRGALRQIEQSVHAGIRPFRIALKTMTRDLSEASMADVKDVDPNEVGEFHEAYDYFMGLYEKYRR